MEQIIHDKPSIRQYLYLISIIVLSSFEYFFRASNLVLIVYCIAFINFIIYDIRKVRLEQLRCSLLYIGCIFCIVCLQIISGIDRANYVIGMIITGIGSIAIACILKDKFITIFTNVIFVISLYSLIIYLLCLIPPIKSLLFELSRHYPSLNSANAIQDGGGSNFIIYNFQTGYISDIIGFSRNCGPFWEPGMFAFFINLSLFVEIFIKSKPVFSFRILIQIVALISSFSAGGYVAGLVLMMIYYLRKSKSLLGRVLLAPLMAITIYQVSQLEYIGDKIERQYTNAEYGSDESRFGAFITQLKMIGNSPIIGGELITDYTAAKTLSSGTLLPLVEYGIPLGLFFYYLLYKSCRNISLFSGKSRQAGTFMFIFIVVLSFSQTILLSSIIYLFFYYGILLSRIR